MTDLLDPTAQELAPPATRLYDTAPHRSAERPAGTDRRPSRRRPSRGHLPLQVGAILILWLILFVLLGFLVSLNPPARPRPVPVNDDPVTITTIIPAGSAARGAVPSRESANPPAPAGGTAPPSEAGTRPPAGPTNEEDRGTAGADVPAVPRPSTTAPGSAATAPPPASPAPTAPPDTVPPSTTTTRPAQDLPPTTPPTTAEPPVTVP